MSQSVESQSEIPSASVSETTSSPPDCFNKFKAEIDCYTCDWFDWCDADDASYSETEHARMKDLVQKANNMVINNHVAAFVYAILSTYMVSTDDTHLERDPLYKCLYCGAVEGRESRAIVHASDCVVPKALDVEKTVLLELRL